MSTLRWICLTLLLTLAVGHPAASTAAEVAVPVTDQGAQARAEALPQALGQVLRRLTGDPTVTERPEVSGLLDDPARFVQRFSYRDAPEDADTALELVAEFDTSALREALVRAGVRIWQGERPPVLVWLAVDGPDQRTLVGSEQGEAIRTALIEAATRYGVELTFPLLDLADQQTVRFTDVAGGFSRPVREASQRYGTPIVLIGSLRAGGGSWRGRWQLFDDDDGRQWEAVHAERTAALEAAAGRVARALRADYTVLPDLDATRGLAVRIEGVDDLARFARAEGLLSELPGVTAVTVNRVTADEVRFDLTLNLAPERALRALRRNPAVAAPEAGATAAAGANGTGDPDTPVFRLLR